MLFRFRTGCQWRDLPEKCGNWTTVYKRSCANRGAGVFQAVMERLIARAAERGEAHLSLVAVDSATMRADQHASGMVAPAGLIDALVAAAEDKGAVHAVGAHGNAGVVGQRDAVAPHGLQRIGPKTPGAPSKPRPSPSRVSSRAQQRLVGELAQPVALFVQFADLSPPQRVLPALPPMWPPRSPSVPRQPPDQVLYRDDQEGRRFGYERRRRARAEGFESYVPRGVLRRGVTVSATGSRRVRPTGVPRSGRDGHLLGAPRASDTTAAPRELVDPMLARGTAFNATITASGRSVITRTE